MVKRRGGGGGRGCGNEVVIGGMLFKCCVLFWSVRACERVMSDDTLFCILQIVRYRFRALMKGDVEGEIDDTMGGWVLLSICIGRGFI